MKRKIIILFFIAVLVGCYKLDSGIVIKKYFVEAHSEMYTTVISTGKMVVPVVNSRYVPDEWFITVEGEYRGKKRQEDYSISECDFEKINVGDFVDLREARKGNK